MNDCMAKTKCIESGIENRIGKAYYARARMAASGKCKMEKIVCVYKG